MLKLDNSLTIIVLGNPIPKPRMGKSDIWKKRPIVVKYWEWADKIRKAATGDPSKYLNACDYDFVYMVFHLPIPPSTPKARATLLTGQHHKVRPDLDNLIKGVLDSLFEKDSPVCSIHAEKFYVNSDEPRTEISLLAEKLYPDPPAFPSSPLGFP